MLYVCIWQWNYINALAVAVFFFRSTHALKRERGAQQSQAAGRANDSSPAGVACGFNRDNKLPLNLGLNHSLAVVLNWEKSEFVGTSKRSNFEIWILYIIKKIKN